MVAGYDPGFVGDARRVRSDRNIIAARFDHTRSLTLLLRKNVAEDATFLALEVFPAGPQLVKHAPRHKHGGRDLRSRMAEFLPGAGAVILEETHVLDARIVLKVHNPFCGETQKLPNLLIAGIPQLAVVPGILHQNFMSPNRTHAVVNAVASAPGFTFNVIQRVGMHNRPRRPCARAGDRRDDLRRLV